jgi:hypothetical protein
MIQPIPGFCLLLPVAAVLEEDFRWGEEMPEVLHHPVPVVEELAVAAPRVVVVVPSLETVQLVEVASLVETHIQTDQLEEHHHLHQINLPGGMEVVARDIPAVEAVEAADIRAAMEVLRHLLVEPVEHRMQFQGRPWHMIRRIIREMAPCPYYNSKKRVLSTAKLRRPKVSSSHKRPWSAQYATPNLVPSRNCAAVTFSAKDVLRAGT